MSKNKITSIRAKGTVISNADAGEIIIQLTTALLFSATLQITRKVNGEIISTNYHLNTGDILIIEAGNGEEENGTTNIDR